MTELDDDIDLPQLTEPRDEVADEREPFLHAVTSKTPWCLWSIMIHVFVIAVIGIATALTEDPDQNTKDVEMIRDPGARETTDLYNSYFMSHPLPVDTLLPQDNEPMQLTVERYLLERRDFPDWAEVPVSRNSYNRGEAHFFYIQPTLTDPFPPLAGFEAITDSGGLYARGNSMGFERRLSARSFYKEAASVVCERLRSLFHALKPRE